ncbi:MAG: Ig-like domain-containing protein [Eubacteriales bacterium]|nr:Ig-like domain-containing protein [Eubacteriales bacterium]
MKTMRKVVSTLLLVCILATLLCVSASADSMISFTTPSQGNISINEGESYTLAINPFDPIQMGFEYCWYWKINGEYAGGDPMASCNQTTLVFKDKPAGTYTVTVEVVDKMNSTVVDSCSTTVTVNAAPQYIAFTKNYVALDGYNSYNANEILIYPTGSTGAITWKAYTPDNKAESDVAFVDSATGLVRGLKSGTANIWAYINYDQPNEVKGCFTVEVKVPPVALTLDKSYIDLEMSAASETITAYLNGVKATSDDNLTWRSSNNAVATVDNAGKVTAKAAGTATITACTSDGSAISNECLVTVKGNKLTVTVTPVNVDLVLGQSVTLTATLSKDSTYIDHWYCTSNAVQLSSNNNTCTIKGVAATGSTPVEVRAYAHDSSVYGYALVTVSQADALELNTSNYTMSAGKTATVSVANPVNGETFNWSFTPNDASIVASSVVKGNSLVLTAGDLDGSVTVTCTSRMDASRTATAVIGVNGVDPYGNAKIVPKSATWTRTDGDLSFQITPAAYWMYLDNQYLNNKSTSQIVYWNGTLTLKAAYLATLANGTHTLKIYTAYDDYNNPTGLVYANIYISGNNATGSASATYGDNAHVKGTASNLYFNAANEINDVYISGKWIDPANYSLSTDRKTLTLNSNFLNQLAYGSYTMTLNSPSGTTQTTNFRIVTANYAPSTGDEANIGLWIAIMILSATGAVALLPRRKKSVQ